MPFEGIPGLKGETGRTLAAGNLQVNRIRQEFSESLSPFPALNLACREAEI